MGAYFINRRIYADSKGKTNGKLIKKVQYFYLLTNIPLDLAP